MIETLSLFRPLNQKLVSLLNILSKEDWNRMTVAGKWTVKDVVAHLLDGNIRFISIYRDGLSVTPDMEINSYKDLVSYLNKLNGDWVRAMKRVSPDVLMAMHLHTHQDYVICLEKLDLNAPANFGVAWAGEDVSLNWFHIARDYTEKWHHQQQIRDAVGQPGILTKEFYKPVLNTFMRALPHTYKDLEAPVGTNIEVIVNSDAGGKWRIEKTEDKWILADRPISKPTVKISMPADLSWKLFTKAVQYENVKSLISIEGDEFLALPALKMITVTA
ncbi:maleylpyruvate isomerase family mycothiol-dependent enzyme [soil metagenome]